MANYRVLGLMSGTSLDGLDLCLVEFQVDGDATSFKIEKTATVSYTQEWLGRLKFSELDANGLALLDRDLGVYFGEKAKQFLDGDAVDLIASHGHTMYHNPAMNYTVQLGHGGALSMHSGSKVVCDFRSQDVILGGQGAPLVPIGDRDLFSEYDACLNLGGFANVSMDSENKRVAWDICPVNFVLNHFAQQEGLAYDEGGRLAKSGKIHQDLLSGLNALPFYEKKGAKSLGAEWVWETFMPVVNTHNLSNQDFMATLVEHCSEQIATVIGDKRTLVTGGGAKNDFLMESVNNKSTGQIVVPETEIVDFKEALIFAYLGLLRHLGQTNVLASATGASRDSVSGSVYLP